MSYEAGSVTAQIKLDTKDFDAKIKSLQGKIDDLKIHLQKNGLQDVSKQVEQFKKELDSSKTTMENLKRVNEQYKKTITSLKKELKEVSKEHKNTQTTLDKETKSLDKTTNKIKELTQEEKKATRETTKLNKELSKTTVKTPVETSNQSVANSVKKSSEIITKSHENNIASAKKEANMIKKYTLEEIRVMEDLNHKFHHFKKDPYYGLDSNIFPIDHQYDYDNYSKLRNRYRERDLTTGRTGLLLDYKTHGYSDFTKVFQARFGELLKDMGVVISSKSNGEFKRVRDAFNGKMVEYLDLSGLKDNKKWLDKVRSQLIYANQFEEALPYEFKSRYKENRRKPYSTYDLERVKKEIDDSSRLMYKEFGKEGNPFIKSLIKELNLDSAYKQALKTENYHDFNIEQATKALNTFERGLKTTQVDFDKLKNKSKVFDVTTKELTTASKAMERFELNAKKAGLASKGEFLKNKDIENASKAMTVFEKNVEKSLPNLSKVKTYLENASKQAGVTGKEFEKSGIKIQKTLSTFQKGFVNDLYNKVASGSGKGVSYDRVYGQLAQKYLPHLSGSTELKSMIEEASKLIGADITQGKDGLIFSRENLKTLSEVRTSLNGVNRELESTAVDLDKIGQQNNLNNLTKPLESAKIAIEALSNETRKTELTTQSAMESMRKAYFDYQRTTQEKRTAHMNNLTAPLEGAKKAIQLIQTETANLEVRHHLVLEGMKSDYFRYNAIVRESVQQQKAYWGELFSSKGGYQEYINMMSRVRAEVGKINNIDFTKASANIYKNGQLMLSAGEAFETTQSKLKVATTVYKFSLQEVDGEMVTVATEVGRVSDVLKTFNFTLLDSSNYWSKAGEQATKLASAMHKLSSQGTENWAGRSQFGYNQYIQNITQINSVMEKQRRIQETIKQQKLDQYYAKLNSATQKYWTQIREGTINLNTYKSNITAINKLLQQQTQRTERLSKAQMELWHKYHRIDRGTYISNMNEINAQLEKQTTNTAKAEVNTRKLGRGLTSFNNGVVQTAHSGRILSNTLYQIRGALLSLKMIFTAMGGMALWGFAMEIAEGVKTTFQAKNEMEAQLKQNSKVSQGGIEYFNRELTELTKNYKKVNKYSIGETVSSVGLEFDLSAEQMKKALPIVTMIQSEYVRAGRKTEEASLAVKDILQGEFQRLSRETGVGKEELIAYGWDEDKENIDGLLDALKKAGLARHWDIFAKKATSLNDVLTITKSRFEETGADILDSASPAIVEGFNMIIGAIDGVQKAFNGMNAFWRNIAWFGGGTAFFGGLATLLPVITKGMGLADIATIGWSKSIGTAVFNLNKAEVAQYGFRKALTAVITGTKASELATRRSSTAILGRVLGVNQAVQAEHGLMTALVHSKASLKGEAQGMAYASMATGNLRQKLIYLAKGEIVADKAGASYGKTLKSLITSTKLWRIAIMGIVGIGLVAWLSAVGTQADLVKKRIQAFNEIVETGAEKIKETQSQIDAYQKTVDKYENSTNKDEQNRAKIAKANIEILKGNKKELELANRLAQSYKKQNEEREKSITIAQSNFRKNALIKAGHTEAEATEKQAFWVDKINRAQYEITNSYNKQYDWLESSEKHINEKVTLMKKEADLQKSQIKDAKEAEAFEKNALKLRDKYIMEYATVAEEAGEHLKQFYQGDLMAGAYFLLDQFKMKWIDLWYDEHFVNFWKSLQQTWESLKPVVYGLKDALQGLGDSLLDFLSTDIGQATLVFSGLGLAIGGIGLKIAKWVSGSGSVFDVLKKLPSKLKKVAGGWKDVADKAEDASKKTGGATSTGGIAGDVSEGKMGLKEGLVSDLKGNVRKYANYATQLAFMMGLITEAILLIQAPMWALAETGKTFKAKEKSIRAGIEGLQVVAPTILAILVPVVALMKVFDKFGDVFTKSSAKAIGSAVVGIAIGLGLVAETILMIIPSIWALGALGDQLSGMESQVKKGTEAMKIVSESLYYLLPFIPALAGGILLGIAMFESGGLGALLTVAVAGGIAIGLGLVAETIYLLQAPLWAIGEIGNNFKDLSNVKRGAEAIKLTGEALTYVEEGMRSLVLIQWEVLAGYIAKLIGINIGADLTNLTDEGGFFDQLEQFTTQFNQLELTPINPDKVTVLNGISTGLSTVGTALQNAKTAIDNIPAELKNGGVNLNYDMQTDTTSIQSGEATSYFEQLKEPLKQLGEFITWFNSEELQIPAEGVNADKLQAINDSATMLQSVNDAVTKVRDVMGNSLLTEGLATANGGGSVAFGGIGSIVDFGTELGASIMGGGSGTGSYKSTLGSSFQQMEDIISDLSTFSTNISSYTMGGGGDTQSGNLESLTTFVQGVSTQISTLVSTLNSKVPEAKQNAESLGKGIIDGIKSGLKGIDQVGTYITTTVANSIMLSKDTTYNTANSLGKTTASKFKDGVDPMSDYMTWEMFYVGKAIDDQKETLGQKAYDLASYMSSRFKEGNDMHSPGIMARSMQSELGYIAGYLSTSNLPQLAFDLANMLSSNFKLDFNLGNFQLPDMTQWTSQLSTVIPTISGIKTQVSTNFNTMKTNVQNSFNGIVSKTQTSMSAMKTSTIGHIGNIKTSWKGMQDALIASAENIKSQTSSKINTLKTNLGDFWNKVKHPDQLIGSVAGGHKGSIRRRYAPTLKSSRGHYAGGGTGGLFKPKRSTSRSPDDDVMEYIRCVLEKGDQCYAGGWNFNWTKSISDKFKGWNTHFNAYSLDKYLNVGKFENSNFPVKGNAQVAKDYIFDVISATSYAKYFDSHFGNNPVSALRAGAFNCWDGTQIVLALARAFGFSGSIGHGTWNGVGHVWANIAGLGIIDPTAIQQRGSFTSSAVKGYSAGAMPRRYASDKNLPSGNNTTNHNEVHIHIEGDVYGVDDLNSKIEEGANRVARQLFRNSYSGV